MKSNSSSALIVGSLIWIGALPAHADTDFSKCSLPKRVTMTKNLGDIPQPVLAQMPGLGAANDSILTDADDPSDPITDGIPGTRLAGAFTEGTRWAVVYETGDFAHTLMVAFFSVTPEKREATLTSRHAGPDEIGVCAILKSTFPN